MKNTWILSAMLLTLSLWARGATLPPEVAVELDFRWLSPPTVAPQTGAAKAEMYDGFTRLTSTFTAEGSSFTWPIRYAIPARSYPIVVLRYRAQNIFLAPNNRDTVLDMSLAHADGKTTPAIIIEMQELTQDGAVHEIRKDLSRVAGDMAIDSLRFSFNSPAAGGRLDILEMRFERGPASAAPTILPRDNVKFIVTDTSGNPAANAEVRAGLIERSNWTTVGNTNSAGEATLSLVRPLRPDGSSPDPLEAMVLRDGFIPQYVAPIEFPSTAATLVSLTPVAAPTASSEVPRAIGQEPDQTVYVPRQSSVVYESSPSVVYVDNYAADWWVPSTYVGYHPYYYPYRYGYGLGLGFGYGYAYYGYPYYGYPYYGSYYYRGYGHRDFDDHGSGDHRFDNHRFDDHRVDNRRFDDGNFDRRQNQPGRAGSPSAGRPPMTPSNPRERAREDVGRQIDRGNEPPTGIETSTSYRRAEKDMRGRAPAVAPRTEAQRGNEPDARPTSPRRVDTPRAPAPAAAPRNEVQRGNEPDARPTPPRQVETPRAPAAAPRQPAAEAAPAPRQAAPAAPDRGDRYRRDGGSDSNRGNEPSARPRSAGAVMPAAPTPSRTPRAISAPSAPALSPAPRREVAAPRISAPAPQRTPMRGARPEIGRSSAPTPAARVEAAQSSPVTQAPSAPRSGPAPSSGDRGGRYQRGR